MTELQPSFNGDNETSSDYWVVDRLGLLSLLDKSCKNRCDFPKYFLSSAALVVVAES